jgi:hypothetical protein
VGCFLDGRSWRVGIGDSVEQEVCVSGRTRGLEGRLNYGGKDSFVFLGHAERRRECLSPDDEVWAEY